MKAPSIFINGGSHRSADYIKRLGIELRWHYDARLIKGGNFLLVTQEEFDKIKEAGISGVSKCRDQRPESYGTCWA